MSQRRPEYSIILAAGRGRRMQSPDLHKVCFPIGGEPAISRALDTYDACGVSKHVIVVGDKAEQVMLAATERHDDVVFSFQRRQIGTADAARCGLTAIPLDGPARDILIVAGDKVVEPALLERLFEAYYGESCDMAFVTGERTFGPDLCRIVTDVDGNVLGNVETIDVRQRGAFRKLRSEAAEGRSLTARDLRAYLEGAVGASKAPVAFDALWELVETGTAVSATALLERIPEEKTLFTFTADDGERITLTPEAVDACNQVNQSIYLLNSELLQTALGRLGTDNAQREEYLSDMITVLSQGSRRDGRRFIVRAVHTEDRFAVMAFNNPEELLEIEDYWQRKQRKARESGPEEGPWYRSIGEWRADLERATEQQSTSAIYSHLARLYTDDEQVIRDRIALYLRVLEKAAEMLGADTRVLVIRSPGRVNLLGRHVDHQGGNCNLMTIGYETLMMVHPREDDMVCLYNSDADRFPDFCFSIGEVVAGLPWDDWLNVVNSEEVLDMARKAQGTWSQYVMAAALRLQKKYPGMKLRGADLVVTGDVPMAAGLSSSSSLVVAAAEAMIAVNRLEIVPTQLVDLAGEGEWFVGTRGGSADHAAIKLGQKSKVVKVTFFDFVVEGIFDFPDEYVLAVCNSGIKAQKSSGARDQFNHRVSCYRIGFALIRELFPQYQPLLHHLRDVNTRNLRVPLSSIYKILLRLPESATRDELRGMLPEDILKPFFDTHAEPSDGRYPVRGTVLFGLSECERSRKFSDLLEAGRVDEIGALMRISHDGDRVAVRGDAGTMVPYRSPTSNAYLVELIEDLESQEPERVTRAQLDRQPGSYACSLPEIDLMVDVATATPGVVGAQLAGAGLGGCMMVLLRREATEELAQRLRDEYYGPCGREVDILWCKPVAGSGALLRD